MPITIAADDILFFFLIFQRKHDLTFHANCLLGRIFCKSMKSQDLFTLKNKKNIKFKMSSASYFPWHFKGNEQNHSHLYFFLFPQKSVCSQKKSVCRGYSLEVAY